MFYVIAVIMLLLAATFVLWPILRNRYADQNTVVADISTEAANLAAFRLQSQEIETEFARGLMDKTARDRALDELANRMVGEVSLEVKDQNGPGSSAKKAAKPAWMLGLVVSLFVVVGASVGYVFWGGDHGSPGGNAVTAPTAATEQAGPADAAMADKQVLALVDNLVRKMEENPDDPRGWVLLARSQNALGQYAQAAKAFARAAALTPNDAQLLADYADVEVMVQGGVFEGKPRQLILQALKIDGSNMKALALAGTADMRAGNKPAALKSWEKLKSLVPKDSDDFAQVTAIINEIKTGQTAFPRQPVAEKAMAAAPATPAAATASSPAATAAASPAATVDGKTVSGQIDLAPEFKAKLAKGDTLFVLARATNGPKMPLAVLRVVAPAVWPHAYSLTDAMAMAPGMNLSSFESVTIEARISKVGDAVLKPGDLVGMSAAIKPSASKVNITINKVVP